MTEMGEALRALTRVAASSWPLRDRDAEEVVALALRERQVLRALVMRFEAITVVAQPSVMMRRVYMDEMDQAMKALCAAGAALRAGQPLDDAAVPETAADVPPQPGERLFRIVWWSRSEQSLRYGRTLEENVPESALVQRVQEHRLRLADMTEGDHQGAQVGFAPMAFVPEGDLRPRAPEGD